MIIAFSNNKYKYKLFLGIARLSPKTQLIKIMMNKTNHQISSNNDECKQSNTLHEIRGRGYKTTGYTYSYTPANKVVEYTKMYWFHHCCASVCLSVRLSGCLCKKNDEGPIIELRRYSQYCQLNPVKSGVNILVEVSFKISALSVLFRLTYNNETSHMC